MTIPLAWGATDTTHVVLVTGSRTWTDVDKINNYFDELDSLINSDRAECYLINGLADGADQIARTKILTLGWNPWDFNPHDYHKPGMSYGRACYDRNYAMVRMLTLLRDTPGNAVHSVAFWKDHSLGTGHTLNMLGFDGHEPTIFYDCNRRSFFTW